MNPFNPGAGRKPPHLAGRKKLLIQLKDDMKRVYCQDDVLPRPVIIAGPRGTGKTVLLNSLFESARQGGWIIVRVEAVEGESLPQAIVQSIHDGSKMRETVSDRLKSAFLRILSSLRLELKTGLWSSVPAFGLCVEPRRALMNQSDNADDLLVSLEAIGRLAKSEGTAVLLLVDELQEASDCDIQVLDRALHTIGSNLPQLPLFFVGASLTDLTLIPKRQIGHTERLYHYHSLGPLDEAASRDAFVAPTEEVGLVWEDDALQVAIEFTEGYPFLIQQCGYSICEGGDMVGPIDRALVEGGIERTMRELSVSLYGPCWRKATPLGCRFMNAMLEDELRSNIYDICNRMHMTSATKDVFDACAALENAGLIFRPEPDCVAFAIPGMKRFVKRVMQGKEWVFRQIE